MKKIIRLFLIVCSFSFLIISSDSKAAYLYSNGRKIQKGSTLKVNLYWYTGRNKAKWSVSNNKIKIVKKGKKWCRIKAKKVGNAYVKCKVGKKTYKYKVVVKPKSLVTYENYQLVEPGMTIHEVIDILGEYDEVAWSRSHTEQEYNDYLEYNEEDGGGWEDFLYLNQVCYKWYNPWTNHIIYLTFNDNILNNREYW